MKKLLVASAVLMAGFFVSCGDDSGTSGSSEKNEKPSKILEEELGPCDDDSEGTVVETDSVRYRCGDGEWEEYEEGSSSSVVQDPIKHETKDNSSSSKKDVLSSSSEKTDSEVVERPSSSSVKDTLELDKPSSSSEADTAKTDSSESSSSESSLVSSSSEDAHQYGVLEDTRNNKKYRTIEIGGVTWMADNLDIEYKDNMGEVKSFCYNDEESNCEKYGRLYTWAAAMDSAGLYSDDGWGCGSKGSCADFPVVQGICPDGWHLPTDDDIEAIRTITEREATEVQSLGFEAWDKATNNLGFSAVPSGFKDGSKYEDLGDNAYYWTKTKSTYGARRLRISDTWVNVDTEDLIDALSVRCVKNTSPRPVINYSTMTDDRDGQVYKTVEIEGRYWMAQNLNYNDKYEKIMPTLDKEGNPMPIEYGKLYTWGIAMDTAGYFSAEAKDCGYGIDCSSLTHARGICPKGWHLPDSTEWESLLAYAKSFEFDFEYQSFHLQTRKLEEWPKASNRTGFSAVPSGSWGDTDEYWSISNDHYPSDGTVAPSRALFLYLATNQVRIDWSYKDKYKAVRCVED